MASNRDDDVHDLWRKQPADPTVLLVQTIREKAERFDRTTRRWRRVGAICFAVLVVTNCLEVIWPGQDPVERSGDLLMLAALLYAGYEYRKHARRGPEHLGVTNCLEFYRAQLVHEQTLAGQGRRYLLPFVPGMALSILGGVVGEGIPTSRRIAVVLLGVTLFLGVAWLNAHTSRRLQRDIGVLDAA